MDKKRIIQSSILSNFLRGLSVYGIATLLAFGFMSIIIALLGFNVLNALRTLITTPFKSAFGFQETIKKSIPLLFTTYAFAIPAMANFFNIGAWGQMLFGGTIVAVVGLSLTSSGLPSYIMIPLLLIIGILAGGLWGWFAGILKTKYNIDPIISTIMLNFVAALFVNFIATAPAFRDLLAGHPTTKPLPESATLGFFHGIPYSIILAVITIIFVYILLKKTKLGYKITAVGYNLSASQTYGIDSKKTLMIAFFIGGAIAGLGGSLEVMNIQGKLIEGFAKTSGSEYGALGILTSLIAGESPVGIPIAAFLMSALLVGADSLQRTMQIPVEIVFISQALIVLFIVVIRKKFTSRR